MTAAHSGACPRPSSSARSGATRARARSSTCSPSDSDLVCRYNGGPNAGHTIVAGGETYKLRHMPSGILCGKECVIGAGLRRRPGRLHRGARRASSARGHLDRARPALRERARDHAVAPGDRPGRASGGSASSRSGRPAAGSARRTRTRRTGSGSASRTCSTRRSCARRSRSRSPRRTSGSSASTASSRSSSRSWPRATRATRSGCGPTSPTRRCSSTGRCATGKRVLLEGAHGTLLDLDHGTYPFVTSSPHGRRRRVRPASGSGRRGSTRSSASPRRT